MVKKLNDREFLHSLSRINDRINQFDKDLKRFKKEFFVDIKELYEDSRMIRDAFDSFYKDLTGAENKKTKTDKKEVRENVLIKK